MWGRDALAFVAWVNEVRSRGSDAVFRLVTDAELTDLATRHGPAADILHTSAVNVWTAPESVDQAPGLWIAPGHTSPHRVNTGSLRDSVAGDAADSVLRQLISLTIRLRAVVLMQLLSEIQDNLEPICATLRDRLVGALRHANYMIDDLERQLRLGEGDGELGVVEAGQQLGEFRRTKAQLRRALDRADDPEFDPALALRRAGQHPDERGIDPRVDLEHKFENDLTWARLSGKLIRRAAESSQRLVESLRQMDLGGTVAARGLPAALSLDRRLEAVHVTCGELARDLEPARYEVDPSGLLRKERDSVAWRRRVLPSCPRRAKELAEDINDLVTVCLDLPVKSEPQLAFAADHWSPASDLTDSLAAVASAMPYNVGAALSTALYTTLSHDRHVTGQRRSAVNGPRLTDVFAAALVEAAGLGDADAVDVQLDDLARIVRRVRESLGGRVHAHPWVSPYIDRLATAARPIFDRAKRITPTDGRTIRITALALAAEATPTQRRDLHAIAAATVLLADRNASAAGPEQLILAHL
jgi:hypothetical protein